MVGERGGGSHEAVSSLPVRDVILPGRRPVRFRVHHLRNGGDLPPMGGQGGLGPGVGPGPADGGGATAPGQAERHLLPGGQDPRRGGRPGGPPPVERDLPAAGPEHDDPVLRTGEGTELPPRPAGRGGLFHLPDPERLQVHHALYERRRGRNGIPPCGRGRADLPVDLRRNGAGRKRLR